MCFVGRAIPEVFLCIRLYSPKNGRWPPRCASVEGFLFSLFLLQHFPFCLFSRTKERTFHGESRNEQRDQKRMTDRPNCDQNLFSTFEFPLPLSLDVEQLRVSLSPTFVGRRGLIGAGNRLQVSPIVLNLTQMQNLVLWFVLRRFSRPSSHWAVRDVFSQQAAHALCMA